METLRVSTLAAIAAILATTLYGGDVGAKDCSVTPETWRLTRTSVMVDGVAISAEVEPGLIVTLAPNRFIIRAADVEQVQGLAP